MDEKRKKCVIIGSVLVSAEELSLLDRAACYVICADGGLDNAMKAGIQPDLLIGDFDSLQGTVPENVETIRLKVEKDDTDLFAAVREGIRRGFRDFELCGVLGGKRMDHSFANFCTLQYLASQGCHAVISDGERKVFVLSGGKLTLTGVVGRTVSVFPFGCASCRVSYTGLKYPLENAVLESKYPLGASNRVLKEKAQIMISSGSAIVFLEP